MRLSLPLRLAIALVCGLLLAHLGVLRAWDAERMRAAAQAAGPLAVQAVRSLQTLLQGLVSADDMSQIQAVNLFYNRLVVFRDDQEVWGRVDHWASPMQLLARGQGDCEDYAIAKYFSLLALGMPVSRLRLVYVRAQMGGLDGTVQPHMVLAYYPAPGAEPWVLDNLITEVRQASRRPDLSPVFSFNSEGLWQGTGGAAAGDPTQRLSRWREVLARAREEGFL